MRRLKALLKGSSLDLKISEHLSKASNEVHSAILLCKGAQREVKQASSKVYLRKAVQKLKGFDVGLEEVSTTIPKRIEEPEFYPEELKHLVLQLKKELELSQKNLQETHQHLLNVEQAFNQVGFTFAQEELKQLSKVEKQLLRLFKILSVSQKNKLILTEE